MRLMDFHTLRSGVQLNAPPAPGRALTALEGFLRGQLTKTGLFDTVEVEHTDDPDRLLVALCQYRQTLSEYDVADVVEGLWDRIRYPYWEAHTTAVDDGHVELQAATREGALGHYVTVHLIAQRSQVPSQRSPEG